MAKSWPGARVGRPLAPMKQYIVNLTDEERLMLIDMVRKNSVPVTRIRRAQILLAADSNLTDEDIAEEVGVGVATVERTRKDWVLQGPDVALGPRHQASGRHPKLDGTGEAHLVILACSEPPDGRARWTLKLLADKLVEQEIVDSITIESVRRCLKKRAQTVAHT